MKIQILFFLLIFLTFSSCQNEKDITPDVKFLATGSNGFWGECFSSLSSKDDDIVIRSQKEYEAYFEDKKSTYIRDGSCKNATLPDIDFKKYSLIGKRVDGSGCSREYIRRIEKKGNQEITYHITLNQYGGCEPLEVQMNWALVPKLKKRTDVSFKVTVNHSF